MDIQRPDLDVIVIGGGPAGLSAALWCADLGLKAMLVEKEAEFGGQLLSIFNAVTNYPGVLAASGRELCDRFLTHFDERNILRETRVEAIEADLGAKSVALSDGRRIEARSMIIATGVRRRELGIPGERELRDRGVLRSGAEAAERMTGRSVVIVGGGDAAIENASILGRFARRVILIHRRSEFTARPDLLDRLGRIEGLEIILESRVCEIRGDDAVKEIEAEHIPSGRRTMIPADAVLIRIGVEPNTGIFRGQVDLDAAGYIVAGRDRATSLPGIFAIGDVSSPISLTIPTAVGDGAAASKAVHALLYRTKS